MKNTNIISLGGSTLYKELDKLDSKFIQNLFKELDKIDEKFIIVVGGGLLARHAQKLLYQVGQFEDKEYDKIGILSTKVNAQIIASYLKTEIKNFDEITETDEKYTITHGFKPGYSTDNIAVKIALKLNKKEIINITNIDYIYRDFENKKNPQLTMSWKEFFDQFKIDIKNPKQIHFNPGDHIPFDPIAAYHCFERKISVKIINKKVESIVEYIKNKNLEGTEIS